MALILSVDTTTPVCSAAVSEHGKTISCSENHIDRSHAAMLNLLIEQACIEAGKLLGQMDAIAVSKGPGSYTGLRIGVSTVKGLCYALNKPMIAVDTLKIMAGMALNKQPGLKPDSLICPMIEARRDEVYAAIYNINLECIRSLQAEILTSGSFGEFISENQIFCCGNGSLKARDIIVHPKILFIDGIYPSAGFMGAEAFARFTAGILEDVAYFEPYYLKDFVATMPKNKVLGDFGNAGTTHL